MAHLLIIELPGGNDPDVLHAAAEAGHTVTFLTADLTHYLCQEPVGKWLRGHAQMLDVPGLPDTAALAAVAACHTRNPIDAVLCLVDTRIVLAADIARHLSLPFLNPTTARLLRNKHGVRAHLQAGGLAQPPFALATDHASLQAAVEQLGLPVVIKPVDGSGSTDIVCLTHPDDLAPWMSPLPELMPYRADYGLGVHSVGQLLVERQLLGQIIGLDIFSAHGQHQLLGYHVKRFFPAPSFAIAGGTFMPWQPEMQTMARRAYDTLDALGFDWGASHSEWVVSEQGMDLIEVNPRLVGARLPGLMDMARHRRTTGDLIALHLGQLDLDELINTEVSDVAVSHWVHATEPGVLADVRAQLPPDARFIQTRRPGDTVCPPMENSDRIGCIMVSAATAEEAELRAARLAATVRLRLSSLV